MYLKYKFNNITLEIDIENNVILYSILNALVNVILYSILNDIVNVIVMMLV